MMFALLPVYYLTITKTMRSLAQSVVPAILAVAGLLVLLQHAAATPSNSPFFQLPNPAPNSKTEESFDQPFDRPLFSADTDFWLGQKQRRRGNGGRVWANLYYGDTTLKPKDTNSKIKPDLYGFQLGLDVIQSHGVYNTFFGNFNQSKIKYPNQTNSKNENYLFGFGKYLYLSGCHFGGTASAGYDRYKIANPASPVNAKGQGLQCNLFGEFGIDFILGKWGFKPFYALQYDFLYHGRIGEADAPVQGDWNGHGLNQLLGIRINWKFLDSLELQTRFTWIHEMLDNPPVYYHARFSAVHGTSTPAILFHEGNIGRDWAWIGCGLKFEGVYNIFLFLDYDLTVNARHITHLANLGLCFGW
ncbi:MAG: autotransporter outer membrane beta-barrel domain-containing protein [Planctomycetaceae bacterium]|jgi:outer membrane autotransporter protein|nr:autotransporter outer membrane beta-barrel domain-containing protein [Planctomycetaceae bacterium]